MNKKLKIFIITLAAVLGALILGAAAFYIRINSPETVFGNTAEPSFAQTPDPTAELPAEPTFDQAPTPTAEPTPEPTPTPMSEAQLEQLADVSFMKNRVNILVLGLDRSVERLESNSFRSDTIILVSVNFKTKDVDMITFPRDSYVKLYDKEGMLIDELDPFNKINSAFSLGGGVKHGGYKSAVNTVSSVIGGIPVNYYVGFDMNAVKDIVNAMGGIDYEVDIEVTMNGRVLHPGLQHLDGQAVLDYCRQRKGSSDAARADRQQRILMALFRQMKSTGQIANIPEIYKAVSNCIDTDLSFEQICSLALIAVRMDMDQLGRHMVKGQFGELYKRDVWLIDVEELTKLVKTVFKAENITIDPTLDGEAILLGAQQNNLEVQGLLNGAAALYAECKQIKSNHKAQMTADELKRLETLNKEISTYIRREAKPYLELYCAETDAFLNLLCQRLGIARAVNLQGLLQSGGAQGGTVSGGSIAPGLFGPAALEEDDEG